MMPGAPLEKHQEENLVRVAVGLVLPATVGPVVREVFADASRKMMVANEEAVDQQAAVDSAALEGFAVANRKVKEVSGVAEDHDPQVEAAGMVVREVFVDVSRKVKAAPADQVVHLRSGADLIARKAAIKVSPASVRPMVKKISRKTVLESIRDPSGQNLRKEMAMKESHVPTRLSALRAEVNVILATQTRSPGRSFSRKLTIKKFPSTPRLSRQHLQAMV